MIRGWKRLAYALLWLSLLPGGAVMAAAALMSNARRTRRTPKAARALTLVMPYPPGDRSGGSKAIQGLKTLLASQYDLHPVGLYELAVPGRLRRLAGEYLTSALPMPSHCRAFLFAPGAVRRLARKELPIVVEFMSGSLFLLWGRRLRGPILLRDHEVLCRRLLEEAHSATAPVARLASFCALAFSYLFALTIYCRVDYIITLTTEDAEFLRRFFPAVRGKVRMIPAPLELPMPRSPRPEGEPIQPLSDLVMLANFYHRPNVDALLWFLRECAPNLRHTFTLHLVGLDAALDEIDLTDAPLAIVRHGFVEDLASRLPHARIAVAPVISGGGVRIKNLYLGALGMAVVTTARGNEGIGFTDAEALVCADGIAMAETIDLLAKDPARVSAMGHAARAKVVEQFAAEGILAQYHHLLGSPTATQHTPDTHFGSLARS